MARTCCAINGIPTEALMVRIDARTAEGAIDWNANGTSRRRTSDRLDINFNGRIPATLL